MPIEIEVDGSFFEFPDGWRLEKLDEWAEQAKLTPAPFHSKGCDLVAIEGGSLWFIEAKDYTYPGARVPEDLATTVGLKVFNSMAVLHAVARWGDGAHRDFSRDVLMSTDAHVCLAIELPHGGRKLIAIETPLALLQAKLKKVTKLLNLHRPIVSNSLLPNGVPWSVRRDPTARLLHVDR